MISKYGVFCRVVETGNFTKAARLCGYSQSAVSQNIKSLESELGTTLLDRRKDGVELTFDGQQFLPYIRAVYTSQLALEEKKREMSGLENSTVRIGTFTSVSRNMLPGLMQSFKKAYPLVNFVLRQGEYTGIVRWIQDTQVDFGFVNEEAAGELQTRFLYSDEMMAVLPIGHPLAEKAQLSLYDMCSEQMILLDEGRQSVTLDAFKKQGLKANVVYEVYDDYSILAMVKQGLGVSIMYKKVLQGFENGIEIRPIIDAPRRNVALAWKNYNTMPYASRKFAEHIIKNIERK